MKNDSVSNQIGAGLAELRKSRGMTQRELARMINTKQTSISRIESGAATPSWEFINRMVKVLHAEVEITFKPLDNLEVPASNFPLKTQQEYICVNCKYLWQSELDLFVIQCPLCHKRQGVRHKEYEETLEAFKEMQLEIKKSPPFRKLPPLKGLKRNTPKMLRLVLGSAASTFPSPRLPFSLLFRLLEQMKQEGAEKKTEK